MEDPINVPQAQRILTVVRVGPGTRHIWAMLEEAKYSIMISLLATFEDEKLVKLKQVEKGSPH